MTDSWPDDLLAVMAHSLLNSLGVISGAAETMKAHWAKLDDGLKLELIEKILAQSHLVSGVLSDLVRSGRPELVAALNDLEARE